MQQTGTLRKRKKRNLAKVQGLSTVPYDEADDSFDGTKIFGYGMQTRISKTYATSTGADTKIRMSEILGQLPESLSGRVTRNPMFHSSIKNRDEDVEVDFNEKEEYEEREQRNTRLESKDDEHSHLLDNITITRFRQILILTALSGALPWSWNKKKYCVDKWSPPFEKLWKIQWFFVTIQTGCLLIYQFYSFHHRMSGMNTSYREVFQNTLGIYWYVCAVYFNLNLFLYKDQIRQYINTLLNFNKDYVDKYLISTEGYKQGGKILINISIPTNFGQVCASVALFLVMPHQHWFLFHYIYPKPWYWLIPGAIQEFITAGQVIASYILICWIVVAHTNSVQFWLRETHNHNESGHTRDSIRVPTKAIETYKTLQILCTCFNDCMSPMAILFVKTHAMTGLIPCGYVIIRSMNHLFIDEFPGIMTYPIGIFDCSVGAFGVMSMGAEMYDLAVGFVDSWSRTRHKNFRRVLMSCPSLKVKVGSMYFMTVSTTVTFFRLAVDFTTDAIITFP